MPVVYTHAPNLQANGPVVQVLLTLSPHALDALKRRSLPVPESIKLAALVDTGATITCISASIIEPLGAQPVRTVRINTPSTHGMECNVYALQILFPGTLVKVPVQAVAAPLQGQNIQVLIGRDILQHGVFVYQGMSDTFTLAF
jgi:predicted aspartyl protease